MHHLGKDEVQGDGDDGQSAGPVLDLDQCADDPHAGTVAAFKILGVGEQPAAVHRWHDEKGRDHAAHADTED